MAINLKVASPTEEGINFFLRLEFKAKYYYQRKLKLMTLGTRLRWSCAAWLSSLNNINGSRTEATGENLLFLFAYLIKKIMTYA